MTKGRKDNEVKIQSGLWINKKITLIYKTTQNKNYKYIQKKWR